MHDDLIGSTPPGGHRSIEGAAILSDDEVDLFELPPEVEEDDLDHLTSTAAQREHSAAAVTTEERLTVEDQVRKARVEKMFEQLNEGRDTSGSLAVGLPIICCSFFFFHSPFSFFFRFLLFRRLPVSGPFQPQQQQQQFREETEIWIEIQRRG